MAEDTTPNPPPAPGPQAPPPGPQPQAPGPPQPPQTPQAPAAPPGQPIPNTSGSQAGETGPRPAPEVARQEPKKNVRVIHDGVGRFAKGNVVPAWAFNDDQHRLVEMGALEFTDDEANVAADVSAVPLTPPAARAAAESPQASHIEHLRQENSTLKAATAHANAEREALRHERDELRRQVQEAQARLPATAPQPAADFRQTEEPGGKRAARNK